MREYNRETKYGRKRLREQAQKNLDNADFKTKLQYYGCVTIVCFLVLGFYLLKIIITKK